MAKALVQRSPTVVNAAPEIVHYSFTGDGADFRRNLAVAPKGYSVVTAKFTCTVTIAGDPADYWTFSITSTAGTVPLTGSKATTTVMTANAIYSVDGLAAGQALSADTLLEFKAVKSGNGVDLATNHIGVTLWLQPA